jgi:transaldolase/transaldolase/glucose-6-phosphate isomerase
MNPLQRVWSDHRQAIWLDYIQRSLLIEGGLERLVRDDGIRGVTSNPSIFCKAIAGSKEYDAAAETFLRTHPGATTQELYEELAVEDIRRAADILRPVYDESDGSDGFVSLEVSPHLAADTDGTVAEAHRLWDAVDRPNLMVKVPATDEGVPAFERLVAAGININVTLMFSLADYEAVAAAYLRGVTACADPARVASVASFFVSRVDSSVDDRLEELGGDAALDLRGTAAVANAQLAYRRFREIFHGPQFAPLRERRARVQRPLWASTSTKNPAYSDVKYVEELIGAETVNTLPTATLEAFREHGKPQAGLDHPKRDPDGVVADLAAVGVDLDEVTRKLQVDGVAAFAASYDELMAALESKRSALAAG